MVHLNYAVDIHFQHCISIRINCISIIRILFIQIVFVFPLIRHTIMVRIKGSWSTFQFRPSTYIILRINDSTLFGYISNLIFLFVRWAFKSCICKANFVNNSKSTASLSGKLAPACSRTEL